MIYSATVKELRGGNVHPNSCHVLVVKGRIPFGLKKKIDIDARRLYPNENLMKEFIAEEKRFRRTMEGKILDSLEKAFNLTRFDARYRHQILADSDSISLIRRIKKEERDNGSWTGGVCLICERPSLYPIFLVLQSLINSNIGDI